MNRDKNVYRAKLGALLALLVLLTACEGIMDWSGKRKDPIFQTAEAKTLLDYWDDFDFRYRAMMLTPEKLEQKLVDYMALFPTVPDTVLQEGISEMLSEAATDSLSLNYFLKEYDHYLYDPNSPMRNETYYAHILSHISQDSSLAEDIRIKHATLLQMVRKNQVGEVATDFTFLGIDGKQHKMHEGTRTYKIVLFYDPTCSHCAAMIQDLAMTPQLEACIQNDYLDMLAISLLPDKDKWLRYQQQIPKSWVNGWDEDAAVINQGLYNIQAYPTIYLLDSENKVVLKDAPFDLTMRTLAKMANRGM